MPNLTRIKISSSIRHQGTLITASLFVLVAAIFLFLGCRMKSSEASPSPAGPETGQQVYDSAFLKFLGSPAALPPMTPGMRKVSTPGPGSGSSTLSGPEGGKGNYVIALDTSRQVLELTVPEDTGYGGRDGESFEVPLYPSFSQANRGESFTAAAALALKAKQFDDGLYAAVEMAADTGMDRFPGRKSFLLTLLNAVLADSNHSAAALLTAAARLGGMNPPVGPEVAHQAQALQDSFLGNELRSKPLGFYTWNAALIQVFQRDRMLQTPLGPSAARSLAQALARNDDLFKAYAASLTLDEKLTNPLAGEDLRQPALALKSGRTISFDDHSSLFPASQSHETELVKALFGNSPIPEGFNLADEMIKRIRAGQLNLKPRPNSGWYDYQTYALEPLVIPQSMPEGKRLQLDESYRRELEGLFKSLLALTRETHVKQLEMVTVGMAMRPPHAEPVRISPDLSLEPLATYYLRRARSYQFVREILEQSFGPEALPNLRRLTAAGPVNMPLATELTLMEALFQGAYLRSCEEMGMKPETDFSLGHAHDADLHRAVLAAWLQSLDKDPDLGKDIRMMVPVFYDVNREQTKVWAVLGIASKPLNVNYATPPGLKGIKGPDGSPVQPGEMDIEFVSQHTHLTYIVSAEVYVKHLLNRTEFRQLCDQKKTFKAIVESLQ